jgi:hypothetical protein
MDATTETAIEPPRLNSYTLDQAIRTLRVAIEETEGELTEPLLQLWEQVEAEAPAKVEALVRVLRRLDHDAEGCRAEARAFSAEAARHEKRAGEIKGLLMRIVEHLAPEERKLQAGVYRVRIQRSGTPSYKPLDGWDPEMIGRRFPHLVRTKVEIDAKACKAAVEAGELPDLVVPTYSEHIRVDPTPKRDGGRDD